MAHEPRLQLLVTDRALFFLAATAAVSFYLFTVYITLLFHLFRAYTVLESTHHCQVRFRMSVFLVLKCRLARPLLAGYFTI